MSRHDHDFDEFLRRLLREEADAVEPADDGLERIRARLTRPRPAPVAWVMAVFSGTGRRVQGAARSASVWLQTLPGAAQARLRSPQGGRSQRWRSPAVLAACAAIAVAAGVLALTPLPQQAVSGTAALFRSLGGGHAGGGAARAAARRRAAAAAAGPRPSVQQPAGQAGTPAPIGQPGPSAVPSPAPDSASASSSAAASPSPSPSPQLPRRPARARRAVPARAQSHPELRAVPEPDPDPDHGPDHRPRPPPRRRPRTRRPDSRQRAPYAACMPGAASDEPVRLDDDASGRQGPARMPRRTELGSRTDSSGCGCRTGWPTSRARASRTAPTATAARSAGYRSSVRRRRADRRPRHAGLRGAEPVPVQRRAPDGRPVPARRRLHRPRPGRDRRARPTSPSGP